MKRLKEIGEYRDMIINMARRELRGKYEKSVLGFLWSFLSPLFQIIIYNVVFTRVFHNGIHTYYIYLIVGVFTILLEKIILRREARKHKKKKRETTR